MYIHICLCVFASLSLSLSLSYCLFGSYSTKTMAAQDPFPTKNQQVVQSSELECMEGLQGLGCSFIQRQTSWLEGPKLEL